MIRKFFQKEVTFEISIIRWIGSGQAFWGEKKFKVKATECDMHGYVREHGLY